MNRGGEGRVDRAAVEGGPRLLWATLAALYPAILLGLPAFWTGAGMSPTVPVEAVVLLALLPSMRLFGWPARGPLLHAIAMALSILVALSTADAVLQQAFGRPLDIPLDMYLLPALLEFTGDALGHRQLWIWGALVLLLTGLVYWTVFLAVRTIARTPSPTLAISGCGVVLIGIAAGYATAGEEGRAEGCGLGLPLTCSPSRVAARQMESAVHLWRPLPAFDEALADDTSAGAEGTRLARLKRTDVLLVFVESYGAAALRDRRYAASIVPKLQEAGRRLGEAGLAVASGRLEAPTVGGLSWLSHATVLSGLWIDNQRLYQRLITSRRRTLVHMFSEAGHRTVGVFPQTLRPWPEGRFFGYDRIWTSRNIDYAGPRFGWTTMPDQYTLWFLQWKERQQAPAGPPLFAELALISSHAPWEPLPSVTEDWAALGTGESLHAMVDPDWTGPEGWPEKAPQNYARALAYSLDSVVGFARRFADERTLMIVLGDHQPAPLITGSTEDRSVPVHVITGDADLVQPFIEWGFERSMLPPMKGPARRMDAFRDWFVQAFSEPGQVQTVSQRLE